MNSSYVCRRCLHTLKSQATLKLRDPNFSSKCQSFSPKATAWKAQPRNILNSNRQLHRIAKKSLSSLTHQGQYAKDEPVEFPSPGGLESTPIPQVQGKPLLQPNNLFHPFSKSPSPVIRRRAAFIKQHAYCPHPSHHQTRLPTSPDDLEARKPASKGLPPALVKFECPDCGIPVSCSEEHWAEDYEAHLEICDTLREINEDDHDLHSGRFFPEFEYPGEQLEEAMVNMTSWDTYLYSREFRAIDDERSLRQATRLLTYPVTIGSVLHELSPYNIRTGGRLTTEGLKSISGA